MLKIFRLLDLLTFRLYKLSGIIWLYFIKSKFPKLSIEGKININGIPHFEIYGSATIKKGNTFISCPLYNPVGLTKKCSIYVGLNAHLFLDQDGGYSGVSIVCWERIHIGKGCGFGGNVSIWDTDFHGILPTDRTNMDAVKTAPIIIGDNVWVGANSIILKGTEIGDGSVIGAGAVVNKKIPAGEIWAGNPVKFIRKIS